MDFDSAFRLLTGFGRRLDWQARLYEEYFAKGDIPCAVDVPTGLGKTSVMALWLIARALGDEEAQTKLPRRLVYVVDRRAVVDQATAEAVRLRDNLKRDAAHLKERLKLQRELPISTLRGAFIDNREWLEDPTAPAIIVGTVDMIGSRILFEGYGVTRKMRPYQAGLLGADALVVLDEAHLVPPFQHLLRAIEREAPGWASAGARAIVPGFRLLPLSATQRDETDDQNDAKAREPKRMPFRLEPRDWENDKTAENRLNAKKRLRFCALDKDKDADKQLAAAAWRLATDGGPRRVVVFCARRTKHNEEKKELGQGPCADGVVEELRKLAKSGRGEKGAKADIQLLVGARRQRERDCAAKKLKALGFIEEKTTLAKPAFLVATSAGEVGVDIDADHMVSDLAPWERMVQRLGRVNRRGEGDAEVVVFWSEPKVKEEDAEKEADKRAWRAFKAKAALESLPEERDARGVFRNASPGALRALADKDENRALIHGATTPEPLRPALTRPLVEAWSMTSLETHTGRPQVAPWLRGWVDEAPKTTLVWRTHLPVRDGAPDWPGTKEERLEIEAFFEAAPPHASEKLETETYHVVDWLMARAAALMQDAQRPAPPQEDNDTEVDLFTEDKPEEEDAPQDAQETDGAACDTPLRADDIAAIALSPAGGFVRAYRLRELRVEKKAKDELQRTLHGKMLILDARFAGLSEDGLLEPTRVEAPPTADGDRSIWFKHEDKDNPLIRFRIEDTRELDDKNWRFRASFLRQPAEDIEEEKRFFVFKWRADQATDEDASIIRNQSLPDHSAATQQRAEQIADALGLVSPWRDARVRAVYLHDAGKARRLWQVAMGKPPRAGEPPYAKTDGKGAQPNRLRVEGGVFRHEFASLALTENDEALAKLSEEARDLALHLIVAHHGYARPVIFAFDPDEPPSLTEERARAVALRFARLQKRWGPWGLAWWEALLRAADSQASRALEAPATNDAQEAA
ncbi:MAG: type I-U CRISPR-associated helicase/endonuclease Cas3 [Amphiplicatus sp.]